MVKIGNGLLALAGSNAYSGGTTVSGGTLQLGNASALGTGGLTANNGTVDLASFSPTVSSLSGAAGTITNSGGSDSTLTVNQPIATTFGGRSGWANQHGGPGHGLRRQPDPGRQQHLQRAHDGQRGGLIAGGANGLSPNSDLTVNGGTLDTTAFPQTVQSLTVGPGDAQPLDRQPLDHLRRGQPERHAQPVRQSRAGPWN